MALIVTATMTLGLGCSRGEGDGDDIVSPDDVAVLDLPDHCEDVEPVDLEIVVERRMSHDPDSYTQGLLIHDGMMFESSGLYGESALRLVDPADGMVLERLMLPPELFGEGIAVSGDGELVQLTWKEGRALRWRLDGLDRRSSPHGEFTYSGEGWGLTTSADGNLLMSDGSDRLVERDPSTFEVLETHRVVRSGGPVDLLNELEFDGTWVWANRYQTDEILRIDPGCWSVSGVGDLGALRSEALDAARRSGHEIDVANGIAFDTVSGRYLLTGKRWPVLFEVTIIDRRG